MDRSYDPTLGHNEERYIRAYSGAKLHPLEVDPGVVVEDVARGLSCTPRFNGQTERFYSVAEHSVRMARWLERNGYPPEAVDHALLHDASEYLLPDMMRPLKPAVQVEVGGEMVSWLELEDRIERAMLRKFGLEPPIKEIVAEIDTRILVTEMQTVASAHELDSEAIDAEPLDVSPSGWPPVVARFRYIDRMRARGLEVVDD